MTVQMFLPFPSIPALSTELIRGLNSYPGQGLYLSSTSHGCVRVYMKEMKKQRKALKLTCVP